VDIDHLLLHLRCRISSHLINSNGFWAKTKELVGFYDRKCAMQLAFVVVRKYLSVCAYKTDIEWMGNKTKEFICIVAAMEFFDCRRSSSFGFGMVNLIEFFNFGSGAGRATYRSGSLEWRAAGNSHGHMPYTVCWSNGRTGDWDSNSDTDSGLVLAQKRCSRCNATPATDKTATTAAAA